MLQYFQDLPKTFNLYIFNILSVLNHYSRWEGILDIARTRRHNMTPKILMDSGTGAG